MEDGRSDSEEASNRWVAHAFASSFDLLSSEYGWTDDQILDLTLSRVRLAVDIVQQRKKEEFEERVHLMEAVAQSIVGGMVGLGSGKRQAKAIRKYAEKIRFIERKAELPSYEDMVRRLGGR